MSLQLQEQYTVPEETAKVAHAVFPKGTLCLTLANTLSECVSDQDFSEIFWLFRAFGEADGYGC